MSYKILTGCGGSVSLLVRPRFTLYFTYFTLDHQSVRFSECEELLLTQNQKRAREVN